VQVFDEDVDPDNSISEKTVTLSVVEGKHIYMSITARHANWLCAGGSKIEAQTPDGTRVATPNLSKDGTSPSTSRQMMSSKASYAAALKAKPSDWHLQFSMDEHILPLDLTIYGAMHQHEMRKKSGPLPPSLIWQGVYTVKFKKINGPLPSPESERCYLCYAIPSMLKIAVDRADEIASKNRSPTPSLSSLPEDAPHAKILRLLRVLHKLNALEAERSTFIGDKRNLPELTFVNNKLSAKLTRQLEEPMIVAR
jgi:E3 ubiquitin-protein ligase TRIP12